MSFNLNVPQSGQEIKNTTSAINTNFNVANTDFGIDHVDFTNPAFPGGNGGLHNKVSLLQQSGDPAAASNTNIVYTKSVTYANAAGTFNEVFMRRSTQDASTIVQLTTAPGNPNTSSTGNTFLPGGLILQWGNRVGPGSVNFSTTFPNGCLSATITSNTNTVIPAISALNRANIIIGASGSGSGAATYYFIAVGN